MSETPEEITTILDVDLPEGHKSGFVAVVGQPNVGKSTLLNKMLGQKIAIVSPRPQTTRNSQLGILTEPNHQIVFVDTPGIMQKALHKLDEVMLETAVGHLKDADVILWLVDATYSPNEQDQNVAAIIQQAPGQPLLVMNKNDLVSPHQVLERTDAYRALLPDETPWFFISADKGLGVDEVYAAILAQLPEGPRYYPADQITDTFVRDIAAELIREQILLQIREEIPHGTFVAVDQFKEEEDPVYIKATIYVERENHKRIVIGTKGSQLKEIGRGARQSIARLVDRPVYLDLWVKVAPKWRKKENTLKRFGYID